MFIDSDSYRGIVDNLYDGLYIVDEDRVIQYWNKAAERISGFSAAEVIGKSCSDNILTHVDRFGNNLCKSMCPLAKSIADGEAREAEVFMHHKDGYRLPVSVRVKTLTDSNGKVIGGVELFTSRSSSRSIERRIKDLEEKAFYDNLTRLANRNLIEKELQMRFEEKRRLGNSFGILFMDIDHFKTFNDTYGHDVGDRVLKYVADTLIRNARPTDLFGRWGGEEFVGILKNVTNENLEMLGNRLRILIENSYITLHNEQLHISISIGATLLMNDDSIDTLFKRADTLLYKSKGSGRNCLTIG